MSGNSLDTDVYANIIIQGDSLTKLREIPDGIVNCCVTSPPYYGLRDYGVEGQLGLEETPEEFIKNLVDVFREVKRVLRDDGTLWVNIGDSYAGGQGRWGGTKGMSQKQSTNNGSVSSIGKAKRWSHKTIKQKDLIGIPWMLAFALRDDGWYLRQDIIWQKPNPMPESVRDRCTKSHEYIFLFSKNTKYYFDYQAIQEDAIWKNDKRKDDGRIEYDGKRADHLESKGQRSFVSIKPKRNKRDVWSINVTATKEAHFATFPEKLIEPCILAGCPMDGIVLDPFFGSGTTGRTALKLGRKYIGIELNPEYVEICKRRTNGVQMEMTGL